MENYNILLNENLDILKEIGSVGMGHASTSLAQMLNLKVTMSIPMVRAMSPQEASDYFSERSKTCWGVRLGLQGDAKGNILQLLSKKFALRVINYYFQNNLEDLGDLDEMSLSVIQEIGNITSGAYCNSLATMTGMFIDISPPTHSKNIDEDIGLSKRMLDGNTNPLIIISNSFFIDNEEVKSDFLFMPSDETIEKVLKKLKEYYGFSG
ncbi:MAG: chemotaxis protein CheC [Oscillospiraceae bacterium]|nr:chemotaxis protein CheC [Oscillospiraceae bacterium]